VLRHVTVGTHRPDRRGGGRLRRAAPVAEPAARTRLQRPGAFEIGRTPAFVDDSERTNVTGSARFRRLIEADDYQAATDVALEQVAAAPTCST